MNDLNKQRKLSNLLMDEVLFIQRTFAEHEPRTPEQWAEPWLFGDADPTPEIAAWSWAAKTYGQHVLSSDGMVRRYQLFKLVTACLGAPRKAVLGRVRHKALGKERAKAVVDSFFGGLAERMLVCEHGYVIMQPGLHMDIRTIKQDGFKMTEGRHLPCIAGQTREPEPIRVMLAPAFE